MLMQDADPEGFVLNDSALTEIQRIARAAHMDEDFTILQHSFFGRKLSTESIPRTLLSNGQILHGHLIKHGSVSSSISGNSSNSYLSHVASSRSVDSNISQASVPSLSPVR